MQFVSGVVQCPLSWLMRITDTYNIWQYSWEQVETMVDALRRNGVLDKTSGGLTFALRGIFLYNSIEQIRGLLDQTSSPNVTSTVTIWGTDNLTDYQVCYCHIITVIDQ